MSMFFGCLPVLGVGQLHLWPGSSISYGGTAAASSVDWSKHGGSSASGSPLVKGSLDVSLFASGWRFSHFFWLAVAVRRRSVAALNSSTCSAPWPAVEARRDLALLLLLLLLLPLLRVRHVGLAWAIYGDATLPCFFLCPAADSGGARTSTLCSQFKIV
jgi:hypothetical protein